MCQSHMEAPAVAGTVVGTETIGKRVERYLESGIRVLISEKTVDDSGSGPGVQGQIGNGGSCGSCVVLRSGE